MIELEGGDTRLADSFDSYMEAWKDLMIGTNFEALSASTISWKVADKQILYANLRKFAEFIEQVHIGTVNKRYIASALFASPITASIKILKILERRPGSNDPLGLDSLDFLVKDIDATLLELNGLGMKAVKESNTMHEWLSLRFGKDEEFEAKFTDHLVLKVAIKELEESIKDIY